MADRTLTRILRKSSISSFLEDEFGRLGNAETVTDVDGNVLAGAPHPAPGPPVEVVSGNRVIAHVYGPEATRIAGFLQLLALEESEKRALARESLDRYKELTMLYSISEKIIGARDPAEISQIVCQEAGRHLNCDSVVALLLNPETNRLELAAAIGVQFQERLARDVGDDILAAVLHSGIGEIVNDVENDPRALDAAGLLKSIICSPMKSNDRVFGVLVVGTETSRHFNAGDLEILNTLAAHAAAGIEVARLDRDLKAASRKPVDLIYGVAERPPIGVSLILGLQHVLIGVMSLAYPVLVTLEAGGTQLQAATVVSMSLIAMAFATVLQGVRLGSVGSGYLAPYITSAIYLGPSILAARIGGLGLVFGMTIAAGLASLVFSQMLRRFRRLFPPEVSGVVVLMVGLSIVPVALSRLLGIDGTDNVSETREWMIGLITLATIVLVTVLVSKIRLYATAIGLAVGYLGSSVVGLFDPTIIDSVSDLPLVGIQTIDWKSLTVDPLLIIPFLAAALASNIKDGGLLISVQKANDASWKRPDTASTSGGLVAGGLGNIASGALGGVGLGISAGSVGLSVATGATARIIGTFTGAIFLVLAFLPKFTALLALVPSPVLGAGLIYVACHLVALGTELIASRMLDARRIYVIGLPLLAGVGMIATPEVVDYAPRWAETLLGSPLATAVTLAVSLNLLMNVGVSRSVVSVVPLDTHIGEFISSLLQRQGATWGARADVVTRAAPAIAEVCEDLRETTGAPSATVELQFDDFELATIVRPDPENQLRQDRGNDHSPQSLAHVAQTIARRYGCKTRAGSNYSIAMSFEH